MHFGGSSTVHFVQAIATSIMSECECLSFVMISPKQGLYIQYIVHPFMMVTWKEDDVVDGSW